MEAGISDLFIQGKGIHILLSYPDGGDVMYITLAQLIAIFTLIFAFAIYIHKRKKYRQPKNAVKLFAIFLRDNRHRKFYSVFIVYPFVHLSVDVPHILYVSRNFSSKTLAK